MKGRRSQVQCHIVIAGQGQVYFDVGYRGVLESWSPVTEHHTNLKQNYDWQKLCSPHRFATRMVMGTVKTGAHTYNSMVGLGHLTDASMSAWAVSKRSTFNIQVIDLIVTFPY